MAEAYSRRGELNKTPVCLRGLIGVYWSLLGSIGVE